MKVSFAPLVGLPLHLSTLALAADRIPTELASFYTAKEPLHSLFGAVKVSGPTKNVLQNQTQMMPDLLIPSRMPYKPPFIFLMVDPDIQSASNSAGPLVTLHTLVSNVQGTAENVNQTRLTPMSAEVKVPYIGPQQPASEPTHNYTLLLFTQRLTLDVPAKYKQFLSASDLAGRKNFPLGDFLKDVGLDHPTAAMYFRLKTQKAGATGTAKSSAAPKPSSTGSANGADVSGNGTIQHSSAQKSIREADGRAIRQIGVACLLVAAAFVFAA